MSSKKLIVLIVSFILAFIVGDGLFPTPNVVGGGAAKMCLLIFLTVAFKATIEFLLNRRRKMKADKKNDNQQIDQ